MTRRRTLGAGLVVLVVVSLVVVLLVVRPGARRPSSAPSPSPSPSSTASAGLVVDVRHLGVADLTVTLPDRPFSCGGPLPTPPYGFAAYLSCSATVHEDYDDEGSSWVAQVGVVLLDPASGDPDHLGTSARRALRTLYGAFFTAADAPHLTQERGTSVTLHGTAGRAYRHQARVQVDREGLRTTSDLLSVEVVRLRDGRVAAFYADLPRDADGDLLRAAVTSQQSMTLR